MTRVCNVIGSALVLGALLSGAACYPMVNPGFISMAPRARGQLDLQMHAGGGYPYYGWGAVHVEPYVNAKTSLPVGLLATGPPPAGALRLGVRHRFTKVFSFGGGLGVGVTDGDETDDGNYFFGLVDFEIGLGRRWRYFGISFAFRPTYVIPHPWAYLPIELGFAFYLSKNWALTLLINGGYAVGAVMGPGVGGAIGVTGHL